MWQCVWWPSGSSTTRYIYSSSWEDSFIWVWIPGAVFTEGWTATQVCDPWLMVAVVRQAAFRLVLWRKDQAAFHYPGLTGAAGEEASDVVLRGVGQNEVFTLNPRCGAFIKGSCFLWNTPPPLLLFQLSNFLFIIKGKGHLLCTTVDFVSLSCKIVTLGFLSYLFVWSQLFLQLLCLLLDGT